VAADELVAAVGDGPLAGSLAIGNGSLPKVMRVADRVHGSKHVSSARPTSSRASSRCVVLATRT
jgi:hypothetical protein